jgi:hypothetical protein
VLDWSVNQRYISNKALRHAFLPNLFRDSIYYWLVETDNCHDVLDGDLFFYRDLKNLENFDLGHVLFPC